MNAHVKTETEHRSLWLELIEVPHEYGWIDAGGIKTRYLRAGPKDAPVLIMLPGTAGTLETFGANLAAHARHFNCYCIDSLGSGFTDKPDGNYELPRYVEHLRDFFKAANLTKASLLGCSLGAWIAARFALTHPEMVEKVTLVSPAGMTANPETMKRVSSGRSSAVDDPTWENLLTIFNVLILDKKNQMPDIIAARQAAYRKPEMKGAMRRILCLQDMDIRQRNLIREEEWRKMSVPVLIFGATSDRESDLEKGRMIAGWMPKAHMVVVDNCGHWPHLEARDDFDRINVDFLRNGLPGDTKTETRIVAP